MPITYPTRAFGRYRLGLGLTYKAVHDRFGFDLGERYHRDVDYRIRTTMDVDRAVFEVFGRIGLGMERPVPRASIEPFGHRFMPAMYGCQCGFAKDAEPWCRARALSSDEIRALPAWTAEQFAASEPVKTVLAQVRQVQARYESYRAPDKEFQPHYRSMSSVQNLGSVINTAFCVQGDRLFFDCVDNPDVVRKLYGNITRLMLLCMEQFSAADGWPLTDVFVGNCTVSMVSPRQYAQFNAVEDRALMDYARSIGARFTIHQDSGVNPHLENYARFDDLYGFDVGQDTDFERLHQLCPSAAVNCIVFPAWVKSTPPEDARDELRRLMRLGSRFPAFAFTLWDIDTELAGDALFAFCETFEQCARQP